MDAVTLATRSSNRKEVEPPPFTFASTFPEKESKSDHISKIRRLNDDMLTKIYSEGIRLEKLDRKLEKEVADHCICENDIAEAHRLKREVDEERNQTSNAITKEYNLAQKNKLRFGWSLAICIPTIAVLIGWVFYLRHKRKCEEKQLQALLEAASEEATIPGPTSQGGTSNSR
jgi:hypothetical protein